MSARLSAADRLARIRAHLVAASASAELMRRGPTGPDRDRGTAEYVTRVDDIFAELVALEASGVLALLQDAGALLDGGQA